MKNLAVFTIILSLALLATVAACARQSAPSPVPTSSATAPPPEYYSAQGCSIVFRAVASLEDGEISVDEAYQRMLQGLRFLDRAEPVVRESGAVLARAVTSTPYRADGALLPFDEIYPEGVEFRQTCQSLGYW